MINKLRRILRPVRLMVACIKGFLLSNAWQESRDKVCWLIGTPDHKNLGDHAITYATERFVSNLLPDYVIREIPEGDFYNQFIRMRRSLKPGHVLLLQGGGNFGNQYQYTEDIRRVVVTACKKNKIIMFPQTIYFTNNAVGEIERKRTEKLYNRNKNIYYFSREVYSAEMMRELFEPRKVRCVPDIVLTLHGADIIPKESKRSGILLCLRDDKEGVLTPADKVEILNRLGKIGEVSQIDTVCCNVVAPGKREKELRTLWTKFSKAELVVTDRLHGMVFAAITDTPCLVFSNYNKKVLGVYDWIKPLGTVTFVKDVQELSTEKIKGMMSVKPASEETWDILQHAYSDLTNMLLEATRGGEN